VKACLQITVILDESRLSLRDQDAAITVHVRNAIGKLAAFFLIGEWKNKDKISLNVERMEQKGILFYTIILLN
jgi:hypothetical protein